MSHIRAVQAVCDVRTHDEVLVSTPKDSSDKWVARCSQWVEHLAARNQHCRLNGNSRQVVYESAQLPNMTVEKYVRALRTIMLYFELPDATKCWAACFIILTRFAEAQPHAVTPHTAHRLVLVAFLLAMKVTSEKRLSNTCMAKYGGVNLSNLNEMERCFLMDIDFQVYISREEYEQSAFTPYAVAAAVTTPREWDSSEESTSSASSAMSRSEQGSPVSFKSCSSGSSTRLSSPKMAIRTAIEAHTPSTGTAQRRLGNALQYSRSGKDL
eukprot:TRINITY_DN32115_c0_g1_i1.p1 TRINITY_DN32115_c0_g1~~TRINITY_DN32115_c0_g1_i1.p1  ORF type:complete len:269 (+),score=95.13 TRINITY_DN32115_c0_g1_i1:487-1293(+)